MAVDPQGIRLSEADLAVLNTLAAESGKEFSTALREAVDVYLQRSSKRMAMNPYRDAKKHFGVLPERGRTWIQTP